VRHHSHRGHLARPPHPTGVPEGQFGAGGADGGEFILMSPAGKDGTYPAKIYNDQIGELEFNGLLRLDKPSAPPMDVNDPKTYSGWDGEVLHLTDGRVLRVAKK
jgi:hypothetical protein